MKAGGAGQASLPRWQNTRVSPPALSSEQHTAPATGQLSLPHDTAGPAHTPAVVLHCPVAQRVSVAGARQRPVVPAQVEQMPLQAELQQRPWTQLPCAHSAPVVQAAPSAFFGTEQLPALSHRLVALQDWPMARALPKQTSFWEPQRPATQRPVLTLGGKSRQVLSAGHGMVPHWASSSRLSHARPEDPQRRHAPLQFCMQHTLPPPDVGWHVPWPQSAFEPQASPAAPKQPPRATLQPTVPHSNTGCHCPLLLQRWKLEPEH
jgi:hypothetical protein